MTMDSQQEVLLKNLLKDHTPILVLGAGFSIGSANRRGTVPAATELKKRIFEEFYSSKSKPSDASEDDIEEIKNFDLADLCNNIQQEGPARKEKLKEYLIKIFRDLYPPKSAKDAFHYLLTKYPWQKIYTFNIDDLVENIYERNGVDIVVQNGDKIKDCPLGHPQLIKLHGCVNRPDLDFVFSTDEYEDTIVKSDFKLQQFCTDYFNHDVVFVGTEFNENDIAILLKKYLNSGFKPNSHNYFFVSPSIKVKLKNTIKNSPNTFYIPWTTEVFLKVCSEIKGNAQAINQAEQLLKQYRFWNLTEYNKIPKYFESKLYFGNAPIWADIFDGWDFVHPHIHSLVDEVQSNQKNYVINFIGKAYVGKSVYAKRLLVEFYHRGYSAFQFDFQGIDEMELLKQYLSYKEPGTRVALLVEEAAMQYMNIASLLNNVGDNIERLVVITTSRSYYHTIKRHELAKCNCLEMKIDNHIATKFAYEIFDKLKEKNRLGELSRYANNEDELDNCRFIKEKENIVDLLYTLNHGRGFQEYFLHKLDDLDLSGEYKELFDDCCLLSALGISIYPNTFIQMLHKDVNESKMLKKLDDVVDEVGEQGDIKVRCAELFEQTVISHLESKTKKDRIERHLIYICGLFHENSNNMWESIFEKLLKTKALIDILKISKKDIRELFVSLEKKYESVSYYWMQRGIFVQDSEDFESAELFLMQALHIRPNSYQIQHALAKNNLERSMYELKKGRDSFAPYYFEEGEKGILKLIQSPKYSNAFCYSVHTYIDMKLKYCNATQTLTPAILSDLYEYLAQGAKIRYDQYVKHARESLRSNCVKLNMTELAEKLSAENFSQFAKNDYCDFDMLDWS